MTFPIGTLAAHPDYSHHSLLLVQGSMMVNFEAELQNIVLPSAPTTQTLTFCAPGFSTGIPTSFFFTARDRTGTGYSFGDAIIL